MSSLPVTRNHHSLSENKFVGGLHATGDEQAAQRVINQVSETGGPFVEAVRATRMPMVVTDPRLRGNPIVFANNAFLKLSGYAMDEVLGQEPHFLNGDETDVEDAGRLREALGRQDDVELETVQYRKGGDRIWVALFCRTLKDEQGATIAQFLSYLDITQRREAEATIRLQAAELARNLREKEDALRQASEDLHQRNVRYRLIVEAARDYAIFTTDPDDRIVDWHAGATTVFGWTSEEAFGQPIHFIFTPEDVASGAPEHEREVAIQRGSAPNVRWHLCKDGSRVFIEGRNVALRSDDGVLLGFMKIGQDVTEQRRARDRQALLVAELQHRVRNVLARVTSVVKRSAEASDDVTEYRDHVLGRLASMGRTQAMLTRRPGVGVDLASMVREELVSQAVDERQINVLGRTVTLSAKAAEVLSLALHELTTNATKYGALSQPDGKVDVSWTVDPVGGQPWLHLEWLESGVTLPTTGRREGFGTELITRRVPYEWAAAGLVDTHLS